MTGNRVAAYREYENLLRDGQDSFYIFSMILSAVRNILMCKYKTKVFDAMKPFQQSKVISQGKNISETDLKKLYAEFYKIDRDMKIGYLDPTLGDILSLEKILLCLPSVKKYI
jgi:DNA polymerase III delta subunit